MKIVLTEPLGIPAETLRGLAAPLEGQGHSFTAYDAPAETEAELVRRCAGADILIIANHPLPGAAIRACPQLQFVSVAFVGYDHVDVSACRALGARIANTAGYCDDAVAELAVGLALACLRRFPDCHRAVQGGGSSAGLQGSELAGKTVGIIGTGAIGQRTAQLFSAFRCRLLGYSRRARPEAEALGIRYVSLPELLSSSDIVSLHTPLTEETRGLRGREELALMRPGAVLVNTARGPVVDSAALSEALKEGRIRAGIDVYEKDPPLPADHPLIGAPNLVCTPHIGFNTRESIERRAAMAFENVTAFLNGLPVRLVV